MSIQRSVKARFAPAAYSGPSGAERCEDVVLGRVDRIFHVDRRDEWSIQIVIMKFGKPHHPLAEFQIAVESWQVAIDSVNQPRIHRDWDVGPVE